MIKILAATALFAGVHTLLASRRMKDRAAALFGQRARNALYRPAYNTLAIASFGLLVIYGLSLPDRELYRVRGFRAALMRVLQLACLLYLLAGVRQIGILRFAGLPNLLALLAGWSEIPAEPEAQGPILGDDGQIKVTGPFRTSRHPLNFGVVPLLWLMPRMTVNLFVFNLLAALYLGLGSLHEEERLRAAYGAAYEEYRRSGVSFFLPL